MKSTRNPFFTTLGASLAAFGIVLSSPAARAANGADTWVGNTSADLSGVNWSGTNTTPISLDSWIFGTAGSAGATLNNGLTAAMSVAGITFNATGSAYTIGGNAITLTGNIADNFVGTETLNFNIATTAVRTVTTATGSTLVLGGAISGTGGGLIKAGSGTLTLAGTNSYTGVTTINGGILNLDFSVATAPTSNLLAAGKTVTSGSFSSLNFNGGTFAQATTPGMAPMTLNLIGKANTSNSQIFSGMAAPGGMAHINLTPGSGTGTMAARFGAIAANNTFSQTIMMDLGLPTGASATTTTTNANGIAGANSAITINGNTWATSAATSLAVASTTTGTNLVNVASGAPADGKQIHFSTIPTGSGLTANATYYVINAGASATQFQLATTPGGTAINLSTSSATGTAAIEGALTGLASYSSLYGTANVNLDVGTGGTLTQSAATLRFNGTNAATVTINSSINLANGGILVTSAVGANLSKISGTGQLAGTQRRALVIYQNNTLGDLQIDTPIFDNGGASTNVGKAGAGTLLLTGNQGTSGNININDGKVIVTGSEVAPVTVTGNTAVGSATITGLSSTAGIFVGERVTQATIFSAGNSSTSYLVTAIDSGLGTVTLNTSFGVAAGTGSSFVFQGAGGLGVNTGTNAVAISPGATLQIGNAATTGSLITGQNVTNNGAVIFNRSNDQSFSNIVSGTGTLDKQGAGILTLSGANTYSGATTISTGTLQIGSGTDVGSIASTSGIANNAALVYNVGAGSRTQTSTISGTGTLTQNSSGGTLTLGGTNTYTGVTTITDGTLSVATIGDGGAAGNLGQASNAAANLVFNGGTLQYTGATTTSDRAFTINVGKTATINTANSLTLAGATGTATTGALTKAGAGTLILTGANSYTGITTITTGTLQIGSGTDAGSIASTSGITDNGALVYNVAAGTRTQTAAISGSGSLTQNSSGGTLTLTGTNSYTGITTITTGTLQIGNGTDVGSIGSTSAITDNGTLIYNVGVGSRTLGVAIGGSGSLNQNSIGGILTLTGANTYSGATNVNSGTLAITGTGSITSAGTINVGTTSASVVQYDSSASSSFANVILGASGNLATFNQTAGQINVSADVRLNTGLGKGGTYNLSGGTLAVAGKVNVGERSATSVFNLSGSANLTVTGILGVVSNTVLNGTGGTTTGTMTQSGTSTVTAGSLLLTNTNNSAQTYVNTATYNLNGGTLTTGSIGAVNIGTLAGGANNSTLNLNGGMLKATATTATFLQGLTTTNVKNGGVTIDSNGFDITIGQSLLHFSGATSDALTKSGSGKLTLTGANTYSGTTTISNGTLALSGTGSIASPNIIVGATTTFDVTAVTGGYTLASGTTLSGTGSVSGAMNIVGTLSPGNSPGTLTTGSQVWLDGGGYNWQVLDATGTAGNGYDTIAVSGILDLSTLSTHGFGINLWSLSSIVPDVNGNALNFDNTVSQSWNLVTASGGISGFNATNFLIHTGANNGTGGFSNALDPNGSFSLGASGNNLVLTYAVVPEPAAALLGGLGLLVLLRRRR